MEKSLDINIVGKIATLWMNRPKVFNAFDETLIAQLHEALITLEANSTVRVVVLGGRGKHFSAGADLNWMRRQANASESKNLADAQKFAQMLDRLANLKKPTIARVHGMALGGGTGLTAACDIAIASEDAQFATSEVKFGIIPAVISPYVLRAIGARQALRYFQSAERIHATRAREIGLIHECCPTELLDERVQALAQTLIEGAPQAQFSAKSLIGAIANQPINQALIDETARRIAERRATAEAQGGIRAFLEKQTPPWCQNS